MLYISQVEKQAQLTSTSSLSSSTLSTGTTTTSAAAASNISEPSQSSLLSPINKTKPSTTTQSVENAATVASASVLNQTTFPNVPAIKYQQQSASVPPLIPGYSFGYNAMMSKYCSKLHMNLKASTRRSFYLNNNNNINKTKILLISRQR